MPTPTPERLCVTRYVPTLSRRVRTETEFSEALMAGKDRAIAYAPETESMHIECALKSRAVTPTPADGGDKVLLGVTR